MQPQDRNRIEGLPGVHLTGCQRIHRGYTEAERWICRTSSDPVFAKIATNQRTAREPRAEHQNDIRIRAPFLPAFLGFADDDKRPILLMEDLSHAACPPPWSPENPNAAFECISAMHAFTPGHDIGKFSDKPRNLRPGWQSIKNDSESFLSLGLVDRKWLMDALSALLAAEAACTLDGGSLCH